MSYNSRMDGRPTSRSTNGPHAPRTLHVGSVSFLNAKPLIYGLDGAAGLRLSLDVPSRLLDGLLDGRFDVALLPVIDYQRMAGLRLLRSGGIGCDGATLTVRVFSPVPVGRIRTLACDTDSHTSVALARVVLSRLYGIRPRFVDLAAGATRDAETALLLIGDKVVCEEPQGFPHQVDLGEAWKRLTGLPFLFAAWIARDGVDLGDLPGRLELARRDGLAHLDEIIARHGVPRGWPPEVARRYLAEHLRFEVGPDQLRAVRLFHRYAAEEGVVPAPPRPLEMYGG
jgi:chorismate dehydratase